MMLSMVGAAAELDVTPSPRQLELGDEHVLLGDPVTIVVMDGCKGRDRTAAVKLAQRVQSLTGKSPAVVEARAFAGKSAAIILGEAGRNEAVDRIRKGHANRPVHDPRHLSQNVGELAENPEHRPTSNICYRHPKALPLLFEVWTEIIELFKPKYFHMWLDEVTLYEGQQYGVCERCRGTPAPELMAEGVTRMAKWLAGQGVQPCTWGDQYLDPEQFKGKLDATFGRSTWQALDHIPKDVIIFDWHYKPLKDYPSVDYFLDKGFQVVGCPSTYHRANWEGFARYCLERRDNPRLLGMHQTAWVMVMRRKDYHRPEKPKLGFYDDAAVQVGVREAGLRFWRPD